MAQSEAGEIEQMAMASTNDPALRRTLETIDSLGLTSNLLELELQGYTVLPGVLSLKIVSSVPKRPSCAAPKARSAIRSIRKPPPPKISAA